MEGESQKSPESPKKKKPKAKRWAKEGDVYLNVAEHIEEERNLDCSVLRVDKECVYGQVRPVDQEHVNKLVIDFKSNPPTSLDLTVWRHPGLFCFGIPTTCILMFHS
jgi:hypothetical protein